MMDDNVYQSLSRPRPGMELSYSSSSEEDEGADLRHKHYWDSHSHTRPEYEPDRRFTYNSHKVRRKPNDHTQKGKRVCVCIYGFVSVCVRICV